jgi:D-alanyl-D-alanine carboxypeptidase
VITLFVLATLGYGLLATASPGRTVEEPRSGGSTAAGERRFIDEASPPLAAGCEGCEVAPPAPADTPTPVPATSVPPAATAAPPTPVPPSPTAAPPVQPQPSFAVPARAVAVIEAPCGALLYGKDEHAQLPPASLTKIITALTAIGHVNLQTKIEVQISGKELKRRTRSSIMGLEPGMVVTVEQLLYGLFLPSGNDAALELATHVSGDVAGFVLAMNETARGLGLAESQFSNPHGLDASGQVSSASDMAHAGMVLMQNPVLARIAGTRNYILPGGLSLKNGNQLLNTYPGAYGVKIGFTNAAGRTIVAAAKRNGRDVYVAVLDSDNLFPETAQLLDWAFTATQPACR